MNLSEDAASLLDHVRRTILQDLMEAEFKDAAHYLETSLIRVVELEVENHKLRNRVQALELDRAVRHLK